MAKASKLRYEEFTLLLAAGCDTTGNVNLNLTYSKLTFV